MLLRGGIKDINFVRFTIVSCYTHIIHIHISSVYPCIFFLIFWENIFKRMALFSRAAKETGLFRNELLTVTHPKRFKSSKCRTNCICVKKVLKKLWLIQYTKHQNYEKAEKSKNSVALWMYIILVHSDFRSTVAIDCYTKQWTGPSLYLYCLSATCQTVSWNGFLFLDKRRQCRGEQTSATWKLDYCCFWNSPRLRNILLFL